MMDFLEKLYSYEYFPQILFATIAILLILLVIVILFGKKDEKIRKEEETKRLELAGLDAFAETNVAQTRLEVNNAEVEIPTNEVVVEETSQVLEPTISNVVEPEIANEIHIEAEELVNNALNNSIENNVFEEKMGVTENVSGPTETPVLENNESFMIPDFEIFKEEEKAEHQILAMENEQEVPLSLDELHQKIEETPIMPEVEEQSLAEQPIKEVNLENTSALPEFNFDELASSISKELDEINKLQDQANKSIDKEETIIPSKVDVTPIKEVTKFTPSSVFSSVYVNKEREITPVIAEESIGQEEIKPVLEEKAEEEIPVIRNIVDEPVVEIKAEPVITPDEEKKEPVISNPFIFDMPAKKEEKIETPKVEENTSNVNVPDFSSFQNETYDIK